jgi:hypothetical protein
LASSDDDSTKSLSISPWRFERGEARDRGSPVRGQSLAGCALALPWCLFRLALPGPPCCWSTSAIRLSSRVQPRGCSSIRVVECDGAEGGSRCGSRAAAVGGGFRLGRESRGRVSGVGQLVERGWPGTRAGQVNLRAPQSQRVDVHCQLNTAPEKQGPRLASNSKGGSCASLIKAQRGPGLRARNSGCFGLREMR